MKTATCGRCGYEDECRPINGVTPDLPGAWTVISISRPVTNKILCPSCRAMVAHFINRADNVPVMRETLDRLTAAYDAKLPTLDLEPEPESVESSA
jgi:hypothetical protein